MITKKEKSSPAIQTLCSIRRSQLTDIMSSTASNHYFQLKGNKPEFSVKFARVPGNLKFKNRPGSRDINPSNNSKRQLVIKKC